MSVRRFFITAVAVLCCAAPAAAQAVKLDFQDGRVTLSAQNVPLRAILNEWARLGGTKIVNGERLGGGPVTLELNGVSERQALDVLLRSASGYLAGPRQPGTPGRSAFASILILPTSTAPRTVAAPTPAAPFNGARPLPAPLPPLAQQNPDDNPIDVPGVEPDDERPVQGGARQRNPRDFVPPRVVNGQPQPFEPDADNDAATAPPATAPAPASPFGAPAGSSRPGVITPVPPTQPQPPPRRVDPEP